MSDSDEPERPDGLPDRDAQQRLAAVRRWVDYNESAPSDVWGPQQNAVVDGQVDAARNAETSAAHEQRVQTVADAILNAGDGEESG
mgnify:CR=1 FL=1